MRFPARRSLSLLPLLRRAMSASPAIAALPSPLKELVAATAAPHAGASEKEHAEVQAWIERVARGEVRPEAFAASACDFAFVNSAHAGDADRTSTRSSRRARMRLAMRSPQPIQRSMAACTPSWYVLHGYSPKLPISLLFLAPSLLPLRLLLLPPILPSHA
jgi:hypothetical protein